MAYVPPNILTEEHAVSVPSASRVSPRFAAVLVAACAALLALLAFAGVMAEPAHSAPAMASCTDVKFTPNSDDLAASIRARSVSCRYARDFIRDSSGRPPGRFRGFACDRRGIEPSRGLPYQQFRCVRGTKAIHWKRF